MSRVGLALLLLIALLVGSVVWNLCQSPVSAPIPTIARQSNPSRIVFSVASHAAAPVPDRDQQKHHSRHRALIYTSAALNDSSRVATAHGLLESIIRAYNQHHNLILRPDDIWIAIMTQFATFVETCSDQLRNRLVDFEGKTRLVVVLDSGGSLFDAPYSQFILLMSRAIADQIRDPSIRDWVLPSFSTSTPEDQMIGAIALMAAMKNFFSYAFGMTCGIPEVTLLGEVEDWRELERRALRLIEFDVDGMMHKWSAMLLPVLAQLTRSAEGNPDLEFWRAISHTQDVSCGSSWLSGWSTVFSVFTAEGLWVGDNKEIYHHDGTLQYSEWPVVDLASVSSGVVYTEVVLTEPNLREHEVVIQGGHSAFRIVDAGATIQPCTEWSVFRKRTPLPIFQPHPDFETMSHLESQDDNQLALFE